MAQRKESFPCITLSRGDFEVLGYSTDNVTDEQMEKIARKIGDVMMEGGSYWDSIHYWAEEYDMPKTGITHTLIIKGHTFEFQSGDMEEYDKWLDDDLSNTRVIDTYFDGDDYQQIEGIGDYEDLMGYYGECIDEFADGTTTIEVVFDENENRTYVCK